MSWIRSMAFCPIATRGRSSTIMTLTPYRLLHITLDYISHVPLHWLDSPAVNHTHTILHPLRLFSNCRVLFAFIPQSVIATLRSHSLFSQVHSLALFVAWISCVSIIACFPRLIWSLPALDSICLFGYPLALLTGLCLPIVALYLSLGYSLSCLKCTCLPLFEPCLLWPRLCQIKACKWICTSLVSFALLHTH